MNIASWSLLLAALSLCACSDDASDSQTDSRGDRYCEIIPVTLDSAGANADVFVSYRLHECPQMQWDALDAPSIAATLGSTNALLNGPRYFLMNELSGEPPLNDERITFENMEFALAATLQLTPNQLSVARYEERQVARVTTFVFRAGEEVYQLLSADGLRYTMQSYAQIVDPTLSEAGLPALASRLELPSGWQYEVVTLTEDLVLNVNGDARVLQDDFDNTYQFTPTQ